MYRTPAGPHPPPPVSEHVYGNNVKSVAYLVHSSTHLSPITLATTLAIEKVE